MLAQLAVCLSVLLLLCEHTFSFIRYAISFVFEHLCAQQQQQLVFVNTTAAAAAAAKGAHISALGPFIWANYYCLSVCLFVCL